MTNQKESQPLMPPTRKAAAMTQPQFRLYKLQSLVTFYPKQDENSEWCFTGGSIRKQKSPTYIQKTSKNCLLPHNINEEFFLISVFHLFQVAKFLHLKLRMLLAPLHQIKEQPYLSALVGLFGCQPPEFGCQRQVVEDDLNIKNDLLPRLLQCCHLV